MTRQGLLRSPPVNRCQPLLTDEKPVPIPRERRRVGEMAGGTAAECAAICCCCPCTVMNLLVLAVYKVPAGLCRKAIRRKKRQRIAKKRSKSLLRHRPSDASGSAGGDAEAVTSSGEAISA
ncbi:Pollen preferential protein [Quillaja saponaria]|uniref:Pollen preferential protein n=1 Tax=Quillaja saponaria TaxID=32244 RepID=A0AAD7PAW1_QUISA|nr:Pollen preferential protein [Quillaja saponaria]